jgi:type II secretory pathway pseudopilin PulG
MKAPLPGNTKKGFATLEILIAFTILILSMTAVIVVAFSNQSVSVDTQTSSEALARAEAQLEQTRVAGLQDFSSVVSKAGTTEQSGPIAYTKKLDVADLTPYSKQATSTVSWTSAGRLLSVILSTILTDPIGASGGSKCSPTLTGDWTAPQIYGYTDFSSSAGATGVSVAGTKAYVTSDPSSPGTDDFFAVDVSSAGPGQTSLPIAGHFSTGLGLTDVKAVGKYAYVAADSATFQLLVIDISDPTALATSKIVKKIDVTAAGDPAIGHTLFYANNKIYLGLSTSTGKELHIFDVSADRANPVEVGSGYEVGATINDIVVKNNIAYLTTTGSNQLLALNVTNPASPTPVGTYSSVTPPFGQSLALDNATTLYFGRTGPNVNPKFLAFDTGNLSTPKWTMDMSKQSGIYTEVLRSNLLFMTTADPNDGLQIWDIGSASASVPPVRHDTSSLNIQQSSTAGTDCFGNLLYIGQRSQRALQVIGPYVPNLYVMSNSGDIAAVQGASGSNTISATLVSGIPQSTSFAISGLPTGATATFNPTSCTVSCGTTLTITTSLTTPTNTYPITVTGAGGVTTTFNLVVSAAFDYSLTPNPTSITTSVNSTFSDTVTVTKTAGSAAPVTVTVTNTPNKVIVNSITPASCTPNNTCTVIISFTANPGAKSGAITVTGTSQTFTHTATINLTVN